MSQKLPKSGSEWVEDASQFNDLTKSYNEENDEGYILS